MLVDGTADSPILSLIDQIFKLRQSGKDVLSLHIEEPDFQTPSGIRQAAGEGQTHYTSTQGLPELRHALASRLEIRAQIPSTARAA